ncbi:MAG: aldehyde ferredoxin oxidoreductase family protein [Firmicutes bacterium]|nr:aldehyde ferredoxin oxidoreductase family protein [Bacillota bacterium]
MLHGYAGKILKINVGSGKQVAENTPPELAEQYLGGRGFVARLLYDSIEPGTDPLGPANLVVIATGPLSGHLLPGSGKTHFGTLSPATGGYGDSNMGGHFGPALKYAGYDCLVLEGAAEKLSTIVIDNDKIEIVEDETLQGKGALVAEKILKERLGEDFQIITIGPAGENKVAFACISHDFGRQAGRTGVAAVLGSKNIKAVAVRGTGSIPVYNAKGAQQKGEAMYKVCFAKPGFKTWTPYGTASITSWVNEVGAFPTRNFQSSFAEFHNKINGQAVVDKLLITDKGCFGCPTPCGKYGYAKTALGNAYVEGPEYESIATLGGSCCLEEIEEVAYANYVCDQLGLDTISAGVVVSFAMECFEKGVINTAEIGRSISFGSLDDVVYLLEKIAACEGIGAVLAGGVKPASAAFGGGSEQYAIHVKGLEWSGYECRNAPGMMLSYMTADVGAHHNRSWALGYDISQSDADVSELIKAGAGGKMDVSSPEGKVDHVISMQHSRPLYDTLGICRLQTMEIGFETVHYEEVFELITGRKLSWAEMLAISEKIWQLTRLFNVKHIDGFGRSWDYPPRRFMEEPVTSGPNEGRYIKKEILDKMLDEYYEKRGWDSNGIPTPETIKAYGLK